MQENRDLHIVVAMTRDRLIGSAGKLPWKLPEDLKLFRKLTFGQTVIMGRNTFDSIGAPLAGRLNIVISSKRIPESGIEIYQSFAAGLDRARERGRDIYCIGGHDIYLSALPLATHLHISWVDGKFSGDTYFPELNLDAWLKVGEERHTSFTHATYKRKRG